VTITQAAQRKAPRTDERIKRPNTNPLDISDIASPQAEKACLAAILDLIDRDAETAREIVAELSSEMWTIDCGSDVFRAIEKTLQGTTPAIGHIAYALRRNADELGIDQAYAMQLVADLAGDRNSTGKQSATLAAAAALEVREAYAKRVAILAMADAVHKVRLSASNADDVADSIQQLCHVRDLIEKRSTSGRRLRVRNASEIEPKPIEWFWPKRISCGSLTIITGLPGLSKSLLTIDMVGRITTGGKWPDGTGSAPRGGVILFGTEDDPEKVVVPRLMAAGADLARVRVVDGVEEGQKEWLRTLVIDRDLSLVREQLDAFPDCRAIVFDPLSQFIECEENSNAQTRAALEPLVQLAQERNIAVIAVMHLNKKTDSAMIQRIAGAGSYGQMARHILFVGNDPDDSVIGLDKRRAMIVAKNSYGPMNCGQLYRVVSRAGDVPGIEWEAGTVEMEAERLNPKPPGVSRDYQDKRSDAVDSVRELLAGGSRPANEMKGALDAMGFTRRQVEFAKEQLGVEARPDNTAGGATQWLWSLPAPQGRPAERQPGVFSAHEWKG
jgi:putative DNA primase/helicase